MRLSRTHIRSSTLRLASWAAAAVSVAIVVAGCGGEESIPEAPLPAAPSLQVPADDHEGATWVREYLSLYESSYRRCGEYVDIDSSTFDPDRITEVNDERNALTEEARLTSERAAWVAFTGCQDGITDYPYPSVSEVQDLMRNP